MDARSLLRAKKASEHITHPYATYTPTGQLKCTICAIAVSKWDAHLLTKQHRQSAARDKAAEAKAARKRGAAEDTGVVKRLKTAHAEEEDAPAAEDRPVLPAGFFSAGTAPGITDADGGGGDGGDHGDEEAGVGPAPSTAPVASGDAELDDFLASLNDEPAAPPAPVPAPAPTQGGKRKTTYKEITPGVASYSAAPRLLGTAAEPEPEEEAEEESEAAKRERLGREEREEIVARLEEETRAQEDADARVGVLKARMEAIRRKRAAMGKEGAKDKVAKVARSEG